MWSGALELMTNLEEEEIRHVLSLLYPTIIVLGVESLFNDS